ACPATWPASAGSSRSSGRPGGGNPPQGRPAGSCRSPSPHRLQSAARQLAATLRALVEAGPGPDPDLASSAAAQLAALQGDVAAAASDHRGHQGETTRGRDPGTAALAGIEQTLNHAGMEG